MIKMHQKSKITMNIIIKLKIIVDNTIGRWGYVLLLIMVLHQSCIGIGPYFQTIPSIIV